jgi:membrane protease YdiL (CAAX protease family)
LQTPKAASKQSIDNGRFAPNWVLISSLALIIAATVVLNLVVFARGLFTPIQDTTAGIITRTLMANAVLFILFVHLFIRRAGGLSYRDLGLKRERLGTALVVTALVWLAIQVVGIIWSLATGGGFTLDALRQQVPATYVLGILLGQLAGNALFEETVYRGFLLPQTAGRLRLKMPASSPRRRLILALVLSQLVFALIHVPSRLLQGMAPASMGVSLSLVFFLGLLFAVMYVRTGNLWICVGMHALVNAPTTLFAPQGVGEVTEIVLAIALAIVGPRLTGLTAGRIEG